LEKKYTFSMEMYESMMKRVTNAEISVGLLRSRYETYPPQQFDLTVGEEDAEGEVDILEAPIVLGSHIVGSPKPEGSLLERIQPMFRVVSGCGRIGRISCTMATLETGQDPLYEASEHLEDMSQHREDMLQRRRETSQLVGTRRNS